MKDISEELRAKVKKYSLMVAWWQIHEGDEKIIDKLKEVLGKIEQTEEELRLSGVTNETFDGILARAKKFVTMKVGEMSENQLETMCKLIFGQGAKLSHNPIPKNALVFDPIKYAEWTKKEKGGDK